MNANQAQLIANQKAVIAALQAAIAIVTANVASVASLNAPTSLVDFQSVSSNLQASIDLISKDLALDAEFAAIT